MGAVSLRVAVAALAAACLAPPAAARPDGPLRPYLDERAGIVLVWPATGTVTDGFGARGGSHDGLDIGILRSLDVVAAAPGTVVSAGYLAGYAGYGAVVAVEHVDGWSTLYAHLARIDVRRGDWVAARARLGLAGCTGSCTGTHLHFEVRHDGRAVDPAPLLAR